MNFDRIAQVVHHVEDTEHEGVHRWRLRVSDGVSHMPALIDATLHRALCSRLTPDAKPVWVIRRGVVQRGSRIFDDRLELVILSAEVHAGHGRCQVVANRERLRSCQPPPAIFTKTMAGRDSHSCSHSKSDVNAADNSDSSSWDSDSGSGTSDSIYEGRGSDFSDKDESDHNADDLSEVVCANGEVCDCAKGISFDNDGQEYHCLRPNSGRCRAVELPEVAASGVWDVMCERFADSAHLGHGSYPDDPSRATPAQRRFALYYYLATNWYDARGSRKRIALPACLVCVIRQAHPDPVSVSTARSDGLVDI
jgi:hypothetical protein